MQAKEKPYLETLFSITSNFCCRHGQHIPNSPFKIYVGESEIGNASKVKVSGKGLTEGMANELNEFFVNTKDAGMCINAFDNIKLGTPCDVLVHRQCFAIEKFPLVQQKNLMFVPGYGGLSLSIEGPSKADIECHDNEDGSCRVTYKPTEPGNYIINVKFADEHVPGESNTPLRSLEIVTNK